MDVRCAPPLIDYVASMALSGASSSAVSGQVSMNVDHAEKRILFQPSFPTCEGVLRSGASHPKIFQNIVYSPIRLSFNLSVDSVLRVLVKQI